MSLGCVFLCRRCLCFVSACPVGSAEGVIRWPLWHLLELDLCSSLERLVAWIEGDLGQDRNLLHRAHIQRNMWNLLEQMVILAIGALFVNSDYNHPHQQDFSYVSLSFVTQRKTDILMTDTWSVVKSCHMQQRPKSGSATPLGAQEVCKGGLVAIPTSKSPDYRSQTGKTE